MRIGAVGNVVMGTIHGESAYSVWDRIVNDLGVKNTSFKATDIIITCAPVRFKGAIKRERRVVGITEVAKHWYEDPEREGGLIQLLDFDANKDTHFIVEENLKKSELLPKLAKRRGLTLDDLWNDINARASTKQFQVDMKNKHNIPDLLEAKFTVPANDKWLIILEQQRAEHGSIDYEAAVRKWEDWVTENQINDLVERRKKLAALKEKRSAKKAA
jgi:hypothetical protein